MKLVCQWCEKEFEDSREDPLQYVSILCPHCCRFTQPIPSDIGVTTGRLSSSRTSLRNIPASRNQVESSNYMRQSGLAVRLNQELESKVLAESYRLRLRHSRIENCLSFEGDPEKLKEMEDFLQTL